MKLTRNTIEHISDPYLSPPPIPHLLQKVSSEAAARNHLLRVDHTGRKHNGIGSPHKPLDRRSPIFLSPGTGFTEDSFSRDGGRCEMTQAHYIYYAAADLTGSGAQAVTQLMGSSCKYR